MRTEPITERAPITFVLAPSIAHAAATGYKRSRRVVIGTIRSNLHLEAVLLRPGDLIVEVGWNGDHPALSWMRASMQRNCVKNRVQRVPAVVDAGGPTTVILAVETGP